MKSFCYYTTLIVVFVVAVVVVVVIIVDFIVIVTPRRRRHFNKRTPVLLLPLLACILFFFYNSSRADSFCWPAPNTSHQFTQCARQMNVDRERCQTSQKHPSTGTKALPAAEATQCRQQRQLRVANVLCSMSAPSDAIKFNFSVAKMMTIPAFALKFSLTFITCRKLRLCVRAAFAKPNEQQQQQWQKNSPVFFNGGRTGRFDF